MVRPMNMRRIIIVCIIAAALLSSCAWRGNTMLSQESSEVASTISVSFIDLVEPASVWILTDTEKNRHTSIWGTAMIKPEEIETEYTAEIPQSGDNKYLFRMIDNDEIYYEADIPELKSGWKVIISRAGLEAQLSVYDDDGNLVHSCEVFSATL